MYRPDVDNMGVNLPKHLTSTFPQEPNAEADAAPFRRPGLWRRSLPFAVVAGLAQASLALPPGPRSVGFAFASNSLFLLVTLAMLLPWHRLPEGLTMTVPVLYVGCSLTLILGSGASASGLGIVILIPLVWTALYHRRRDSSVVLIAVVMAQVTISLTPVRVADAVLFRRAALWAGVALLIAFATHDLRARLKRTLEERDAMLRRAQSLQMAAEELSNKLTVHEVLVASCRLAARLASPSDAGGRRAQYVRPAGAWATVVAQHDEANQIVTQPFPVSEHPELQEVLRTGTATSCALGPDRFGPTVHDLIVKFRLTYAVYVPIHWGGKLDGVLSVSTREHKQPPDLLAYCQAFGHLMELALENARAHELAQAQATTDELTGLANRRAFNSSLDHRPGRLSFAILVIDIDGLKSLNDTKGHHAGDELLTLVARTLAATLRSGDVLARLGGDEFAALLFDTDEMGGRDVAKRMLQLLRSAPCSQGAPSVSIGVACGRHDANGLQILAAADAAMYRAKRLGGGRFVVDGDLKAQLPALA